MLTKVGISVDLTRQQYSLGKLIRLVNLVILWA